MKRKRTSHGVHFLLSAKARKLSITELYTEKSDADVSKIFHEMRWPETQGRPCCPKCNETDCVVSVPKRALLYRCKACEIMFSLTSGTFLHGCKLPLRKLLVGILLLADAEGHERLAVLKAAGCSIQDRVRAHAQDPREPVG